jgi:hypothetical protein
MSIFRLSAALIGLPFLASCIHLYSDYDPDMDKGITQVKEGLSQQVAKLRDCAVSDTRAKRGPMPADPSLIICVHPNRTYDARDYNKIEAQLDSLIVRSQSVPHNSLTTANLLNIEKSILEYPPIASSGAEGSTKGEKNSNVSAAGPGTDLGASGQKQQHRISIQERHQIDKPMALDTINELSDDIDTRVRSILTVELAKKSGEKKDD